MSTRTAQFYNLQKSFETRYLSLTHSFNAETISISLKVNAPYISTKSFAQTTRVLERLIPSIFTSQCFNDLDLPFSEEVKNTEIGHLLEHILLELLCIEKMNHGYDEADFSGETSWNWIKEPHGTFRITINCLIEDFVFFMPSLEKSIQVLEEIMVSNLQDSRNVDSFFHPTYSSSLTI